MHGRSAIFYGENRGRSMLHVTNGKAARVLIKGDSKYEARISGSVLVTENSPLTLGKRERREM